MASSQDERIEEIATQLSYKETETLGEIMKQAESSLESQQLMNECHAVVAQEDGLTHAKFAGPNIAGPQFAGPQFAGPQFAGPKFALPKVKVTVVGGALRNQGKEPKRIMDSKKYSGHIVKDFPATLGTGAFAMSAMSDKGVKAAVVYSGIVYSGKNKTRVECGWLLAFADTKATGRRIYAECGRKIKFNNINWDKVEQNLNKAGIYAKVNDEETGTSVIAGIGGTSGKSAIAAAFSG
ncbi:hypothetical protein ACP70R_007675 [Stipagrostis hirtigluma subsp. patula]